MDDAREYPAYQDQAVKEEDQTAKFPDMPPSKKVSKSAIITLLVLVYINLLNYMDRFTVSGVLPKIQHWFNDIGDEKAGLLQTVFVCSYMVFAPAFGYLGDRFSRKIVMAIGISIWSVTTFSGSLMGRDQFWWFFLLRGLVGIGEASYSTVAPTIIADLFVGDHRSKALSLFYFAIPCGSGLGYIVGSKVTELMNNEWQWALRVTPVLGVIAVLLVLVVVREPKRGAIEVLDSNKDDEDIIETPVETEHSTYLEDLKKIFCVPSFNYATAGFACVSFVVGALSWWVPKFALQSEKKHSDNPDSIKLGQVSYIFGIVTFVAGVAGVWLGAEVARRWRKRDMRADALVCGIGVLLSAPFLFFTLYIADKMIILCWVLIVVGEIFMFLNWAPNGDILLYVIPPNCRSTAEAIQILIIHLLGDAISPFIVGVISKSYKKGRTGPYLEQKALLYSLYMTPFICVFSALFYFLCGNYLEEDKRKADEETKRQVVQTPAESILDSFPRLHTPVQTSIPDTYDNSIESEDYDDTAALIKNDGHYRERPVV